MPERRKRTGARIRVALSCSRCGTRNYKSTKARRPGSEILKLRKFCRSCNQHTMHIEAA